jgi:HAD superfamily hydrolase (TIGR01509 family)
MESQEKPLSYDEAVEEAKKMQDVIRRRKVIGAPLTSDYEEAHEKVEQDKSPVHPESVEPRNIEELIDLIIFDWDGVMYDSMDNIAKTAVEITKHFGKGITEEQFHESYDQPFWDYYKRLGIPVETEDERAYIYKIYHDEILPKIKEGESKKSTIYPEVEDTLRELVARHIKVAIVSAHKTEEIIEILTQGGLLKYIDYPIGLAHNKTEAIKQLCMESGVTPERALMLGDLPSDLRDARKAGVRVGAVARRNEFRDRLGSHNPDFVFETVGPEIFHLTPHLDKSND